MKLKSQKVILIAGIFFLGTSSPALSASKAKGTFETSFNCTKVKSAVEKEICENKDLATLMWKWRRFVRAYYPACPIPGRINSSMSSGNG